MKLQHAKLIQAMVEYDKGDVPRIQHFMKVHDFAVTYNKVQLNFTH